MSHGERTPLTGRHTGGGDIGGGDTGGGDTGGGDNPLAALIDQMQQNWDLGDNAANDDLVIQIREHIRLQRLQADAYSVDRAPEADEHPKGTDAEMDRGRWMPEHTQAVADDVDYWSEHGVQVISIRPRVDGIGAVIGVRRLTNHIATAMQQRYSFPIYCWDVPPPRWASSA